MSSAEHTAAAHAKRRALGLPDAPEIGTAATARDAASGRDREADRIDEQMYRAGGAPGELRRLAEENTGLPACPFCGGELCAVTLADHGPGVSCSGCGAYTSRLPWREPWLFEGSSRV